WISAVLAAAEDSSTPGPGHDGGRAHCGCGAGGHAMVIASVDGEYSALRRAENGPVGSAVHAFLLAALRACARGDGSKGSTLPGAGVPVRTVAVAGRAGEGKWRAGTGLHPAVRI